MDSYQLRYALLKTLPMFTAVCASDQLETLKVQDNFAIIVNNEPSSENGMHWVCFYKDSRNDSIEFFDSYAMNISFYPMSFMKFIKARVKKIRFNKFQIQSNESNFCGHYCLWFLIHRHLKLSFEDVIKTFSQQDYIANDQIVKDFVNQYFNFPEFSNCRETCQDECLKQGVDFSSVCQQLGKNCSKVTRSLLAKF